MSRAGSALEQLRQGVGVAVDTPFHDPASPRDPARHLGHVEVAQGVPAHSPRIPRGAGVARVYVGGYVAHEVARIETRSARARGRRLGGRFVSRALAWLRSASAMNVSAISLASDWVLAWKRAESPSG